MYLLMVVTVVIDTLRSLCILNDQWHANNAVVRQEKLCGSHALCLVALLMCMIKSFQKLARNAIACASMWQPAKWRRKKMLMR